MFACEVAPEGHLVASHVLSSRIQVDEQLRTQVFATDRLHHAAALAALQNPAALIELLEDEGVLWVHRGLDQPGILRDGLDSCASPRSCDQADPVVEIGPRESDAGQKREGSTAPHRHPSSLAKVHG